MADKQGQWEITGLLDMHEAQERINALGWRMTGIEIALEKDPHIRMNVPTTFLVPERAADLQRALKTAEDMANQAIINAMAEGGPNGSIH